jgi:cytochrome c-type biogenesis protein CcmF
MDYINEHTLLAHAGRLLIIIAFVSSLTTLTSYLIANGLDTLAKKSWQRFSNFVFVIHSIAVLLAVLLLFYAIYSHYFEFHYVWKYSSLSMELRYIFSCFWSGQEGSLLLWSFWIVILSLMFIATGKEWVSSAMPVVCAVQAFIYSMLLGVYIGDIKVGSSPFVLIRELPENAGMPWASMNDYLVQITSFQDGVGLNPLLQNYWMTIHPPVLFLGFASTLFPFALALAGLMRRDYNGWARPALQWGIFGMAALGAGILLGGAWAYESLSFGGFWAWDPVENASLVPWLVLVAGVHCLQITIKRGRALFVSILFSLAPFLLVLYSTFLTRSGILGESSVHSFTENGLFYHLLAFLFSVMFVSVFFVLKSLRFRLLFSVVSSLFLLAYFVSESIQYTLGGWMLFVLVMLIVSYEKEYDQEKGEVKKTSKEFWMLTGALVILVSALQITVSTSIPVINKVFGLSLDAFTDLRSRNAFYHTWQIPMAVVVTLLMGVSQFLAYYRTHSRPFFKKIAASFLITLLITVLLVVMFNYNILGEWQFVLLLFSTILVVVLNIDFLRRIWKSPSFSAGSSVAHIGFALLLFGALLTGSRKSVISKNAASFSLQELNKDFRNDENILLRQGDTVLMKNYLVTYLGREKKGVNLHYNIGYFEPVLRNGRIEAGDSLFTLSPIVQLNEQFGNVAEPGTYHSIAFDVFTHIKYADMESVANGNFVSDGYMGETTLTLPLDSMVSMENLVFRLNEIYIVDSAEEKEVLGFNNGDIVVRADISVKNTDAPNSIEAKISPLFVVRDSSLVVPHELFSSELDAKVRIVELPQEANTIVLGLRQREFVVMQALVFPGINFLWAGCILMVLGCILSLRYHLAVRSMKSVSTQNITGHVIPEAAARS